MRLSLAEVAGALAFAGDLSMGQPVSHSPRAALIARAMAMRLGLGPEVARDAFVLALLRWAGCTANAAGFAAHFGDDIAARAALLAGGPAAGPPPRDADALAADLPDLARAHCEVGMLIAHDLELGTGVEEGFLDLFEHWDGSGMPRGRRGEEISPLAQIAMAAGTLEVTARWRGPANAAARLARSAGAAFGPLTAQAATSDLVPPHGPAWPQVVEELGASASVPGWRNVLAAFSDLKAPAAAGVSARAAVLGASAARIAGLATAEIEAVETALVLQGLGRVAVPSPLLDRPAGDEAGEEAGRLVPYWTHRILSRARTLEPAARICLRLGERVDGSGALGLTARDLGRAERLAIAALVHAEAEASGHRPEVALARACRPADAASVLAAAGRPVKPPPRPFGLTGREAAVLELIAVGRTNTEIGLLLEISPKTVGSHVAAIFDKLGVSTRAAAGFVALRDDLVRPSR